jgi:23S rRNA pseudouridine1911/1915/1917 synthase
VTLTIPDEQAGARLDAVLAALLPQQSRSQIQRLIKDGRVQVAGVRADKVKASLPVEAGQEVAIDMPPPAPAAAVPQALPLDVVYEDGDIVVVNKAAGMVVHPAAGHADGTLVNALLHHVDDLSGIGGELRPGIVHRLDKGTSGLMVVAKHDAAHEALAAQFEERHVEKEYVALVWGVLSPGRRIEEPIGRDPNNRQRMSTRARRARTAVSRITWAEPFPGVCLVGVGIATGRTHQIRVHLAAMGWPLLGDATYGVPHAGLTRQALHARRITLTHPVTGVRVQIAAPLPDDIVRVLP